MFFIPTKLNIGDVKVNTPDNRSTINFGSTMQVNIHVAGKKNQAYGQQFADISSTLIPLGIVLDDDWIDFPSIKRKNMSTTHRSGEY